MDLEREKIEAEYKAIEKLYKAAAPAEGAPAGGPTQDANGNNRTAFEVLAKEVSFCGSKAETGTQAPVNPAAPAPAYQTAVPSDFEEITDDDDLPF